MSISFPTSLDALTNPTPTNGQDSPSHSTQHSNANDAIEALEAKVGVDSSAVATSNDARITVLESTEASDVQGPASAVDDNLTTFDGTTGKLIQDSGTNISAVTANTAKITFDSTSSTKLGTIEENADVTDTANVTSAGALMDSELTSIADVKALDQSVVSGATPTFTGTNISAVASVVTITGLAPDTATTQATQASITSAANLVTVGTIGTGTWQGTAINATYLDGQSGTNTGDQTITDSKSITIETPTDAEDLSMFFTNKAVTITEIRAVLIGSDTPSVTWTIRQNATDRSAAGTEVVTGGTTTTSITGGSDVTSFDDETVPADSFVWLETTAQSGTVTQLAVTIIFTED